ncbi:MAG TPA: CoA pyrophosphatase [Bacteroidales bacterium]|nr:CoA pyrophosphatase [Bacteroidales bacterium]
MNAFASSLKDEILKGLPGTDVQWQMSSRNPILKKIPLFPGEDARVAAVLILLYQDKGTVHTVFMQRPQYEGIHGGQISFPGGKKEPEDDSIIKTALRETWEETGVDPSKIAIIGTLTPLFIPVSNMLVTPVVGWIDEKPSFDYQTEEVSYLINAELKSFLDTSIVKSKPLEIRGEMVTVKYFDYEGNTIWGATAMILEELLVLIKRGDLIHQE